MPEQDPILLTMLQLKDNWALTGDLVASSTTTGSGIKFGTRWYDTGVAYPQVCVIPVGSSSEIMETGASPTYKHADVIKVGISVRPKQDSNTSIGWAKNASYQLKKEVDRILESGSTFSSGGINFFYTLGRWRVMDRINLRPIILRSEREITVNYYVKRK